MRQLSRYASLATICWLKGTSAAAADNATKIAHTQQVGKSTASVTRLPYLAIYNIENLPKA